MNLRDLTYIIAVAEQGHFGRAAEVCHVSQPTLSGQILKLEDDLGVKIFEREGRRIRPTAVGIDIIQRARQAVAAADDITLLARANQDPLAGPIRLGIIPTLAPYVLPWILPLAAESLPRAPLMVAEDTTQKLLEGLMQGSLDAALMATDAPERMTEIPLFDEPFWLVLPPGHPLARQNSICADDLSDQNLLLLNDGHCLRDQALDFCGGADRARAAGADVRATSLETLLHLTAANYGMTLVPRMAVRRGGGVLDHLAARPLDGPNHARRVRIVHRSHSPRSAALEKLATAIRDGAPDCVTRVI